MARQGGVTVTRILADTPVAAPPEIILSLRRWDGVALVGASNPIVSSVSAQWNATLKRYTRQVVPASDIRQESIQSDIEPRAIVDPRYPASGLVVRVRDSVHQAVAGNPPWGNSRAQATFGLRAGGFTDTNADINGTPFIGFRADIFPLTSVTNPTWRADFVNWDQSTRRSIDTGLGSNVIRDLMIELSGVDQTIRWYIDGNLVSSFKPNANDVGGQNGSPTGWFVTTGAFVFPAGSTPATTFSFHLGIGPLITCIYHDA